ncbi:MAG: ribonuclease [Sphingomonadales bacterium]|nr:ribonuclease [Sphingomonadales bacterium]
MPSTECLVEEGIGEHRAVLLQDGRIVHARIDWLDALVAGQVEDAVLASRAAGSSRGTARFANGEEALVDRLPREASEGARLRLEVTRAAMPETGRAKLAQARPTTAAPGPRPSLADTLRAEGWSPKVVRRFPADWDELWAEAEQGSTSFAGGTLHFALTPAMTVIDVDGDLPPRELALAAVAPLASALERFDLAGNIGIDFPTLEAKVDRKAIDAALDAQLDHWPHERTAMNGFGFVQIVARLRRPSLLHRLRFDAVGAAARRLLRQAEQVDTPGALLLACNPAVKAALTADWLAQLARRSGRAVRIETNPALALTATFAQAVTS